MKINRKWVKIIACVSLTAIFIYKFVNHVHPKQINPDLKYILLWTPPRTEPLTLIGLGQSGVIKRNCSYTNCFVTADRNYFDDYRKFHAVVFVMKQLVEETSFWFSMTRWNKLSTLPLYRSHDQKYVFTSTESSHYYPACSDRFNDYFNWTWSFRLDSDCRYEYIAVRDTHGNVIGPNKIMHWMKVEDMSPVSNEFKNSLQSKIKAAAWFVSSCYSRGKRQLFVIELQKELTKYNHTIDIYGDCGSLSCPKQDKQQCLELLKNNYYFYLSFENSFSEDYVTEKLLTALKNNAIPIVYGEANYTRYGTLKSNKNVLKDSDNDLENPTSSGWMSCYIIKPLYTIRLPISAPKYKDLIKLCETGVIPKNFHAEYRSLPSAANIQDVLPETDEEDENNDNTKIIK